MKLIQNFPKITEDNRMDIFEMVRDMTLSEVAADFAKGNIDKKVLEAVREEMEVEINQDMREMMIAAFAKVLQSSFEDGDATENLEKRKEFYETYIRMFEITMEMTSVHMELLNAGK